MENIRHGMLGWLILFLAAMLMTGCGSMGINSEDSKVTGDEGAVKGKSAATVYIQLAGEYLRQGERKPALENAKKAVVADPNNSNASTVLAMVYESLGENDLAEKHFKRALKIDRQNSDAANGYGSFLCRLGRFEEADKRFKQAMTNPLYRTPWIPVNNAGICARSNGQLEKAAAYFREALQYNPAFPSALLYSAKTSYELGNYPEAKNYLQRYLSLSASNAESLALAANIERKLGRTKQAASYEMLLRSTYPESTEAQSLRSNY